MSLEKGSTVFTRLPDCERPLGGSDTNDYMIACFLVLMKKNMYECCKVDLVEMSRNYGRLVGGS